MPTYIDSLPQHETPIVTVSLRDLLRVLPTEIPYKANVWISGKLARYGIATGNLVFFVEQHSEPDPEQKQYFDLIVQSLGVHATASHNWRDDGIAALRLYNNGRLIIDPETLSFTEAPEPIKICPVLELDDVLGRLWQEIPWGCTIWLTGGLTANGWSANDADFIVFDEEPSMLVEIRNHLRTVLGWKVHVGNRVMPEREPVYLYKLYEGGVLCRP